jgi:hypothetical protein
MVQKNFRNGKVSEARGLRYFLSGYRGSFFLSFFLFGPETSESQNEVRGMANVLLVLAVSSLLGGTTGVSAFTSPLRLPSIATSAGAGTRAWTNPTYATSTSSLFADSDLFPGETSEYLYLRSFGFSSSVPLNAVVTGVEAQVRRKKEDSLVTINDVSVRLLYSTPQGSEKSTGLAWPLAYETRTFGSTSDLWGVSLTTAQMRSTSFGLSLRCVRTGGSNPKKQAQIDYGGFFPPPRRPHSPFSFLACFLLTRRCLFLLFFSSPAAAHIPLPDWLREPVRHGVQSVRHGIVLNRHFFALVHELPRKQHHGGKHRRGPRCPFRLRLPPRLRGRTGNGMHALRIHAVHGPAQHDDVSELPR